MTLALAAILLAQSEVDRAAADLRAGRTLQAESALKAIVAREPDNATAWRWLGVVYASQSDHELAEKPFAEACRLAPSDPDACYFHGRNLYALNRFVPAADVLRKALDPGDRQRWRVHSALAQALEAAGDAREAEKQFHAALAASPSPGRAEDDPLLHFGVFLLRQGRTREALDPLAKAQPSARAFTELGRALLALDRLEDAAARLERALALDPRHAQAHLLLAKAYQRLGRTADAERHSKLAAIE
jgi:Tfp pilus assembly protein PilF